MKILSLDLSTKSSGWAVFENEQLLDYGCIASASADLIKRIHIMGNGIKEVLNKYTIDKVVLEEVRPEIGGYGVGNLQTHRALMWLQAEIAFILHDNFNKTEVEYIYPSSWRSVCNIKNGRGVRRETLKELDKKFAKEKFNVEVNDDIADAIGIGYAQYHKDEDKIEWGE